jgi:hypothetical protein
VPTVTVRFIGLCTHIRQSLVGCLPRAHRVVIMDNEPGEMFGKQVEAHSPLLTLPGGEQRALEKMTLEITGSTQEKTLSFDRSWEGVPHLAWTEGQQIELNTGIVCHGVSPAAVYFDVSHGSFFACQLRDGAVITRLVMQFDGAATLHFAPFGPGQLAPPSPMTFDDDVSLTITNMVNSTGGDSENDYVLNYRLFHPWPEEPSAPEVGFLIVCEDLPPDIDLGPKCSNTNYP